MDDSIWASIIRAKYTPQGDIFSGSDRGGSQFWTSLHKIKHLFKLGAKYSVCNGQKTRFWTDWWQGEAPLYLRFPQLFSICDNPTLSVASVVVEGCHFRRTLDPMGAILWQELNDIIISTALSDGHDSVSWHLDPSGKFSVSSLYSKLSQGAMVPHFRDLWKAKVPLKIKVFSWQLSRDRLPSGGQLISRQGPSDGLCELCGEAEDASHMFFKCSIARFAWSVLRQVLGRT